jgi:hypothetical protein
MPERFRRPPLMCNYKVDSSDECFETFEEACAAIRCPLSDCGSPYGFGATTPHLVGCN